MNKILNCLCFLVMGMAGIAQSRNADSLIKAFETSKGIDRGETAMRISNNYWVVGMPNDGKKFNSALHWARTTLT